MYTWSNNQLKLNRAMDKVGPKASEQEIKAEYMAIGGKLINVDEIKQEVQSEVVAEPVSEVAEVGPELSVEESPKVESSELVESPEASEITLESVVTTDDVA